MGKKVYLLFLMTADFLSFLVLMSKGKYSFDTLLVCLVITWLGYLFVFGIYKYLNRENSIHQKISFIINNSRLDWFVLFFLIIMILYSARTGDGGAETASLYSSSIFASLWTVDALFPFYFWINRSKKPKFVLVNTIIYVVYKLLLGWTGAFFIVAFFELFYRLKDKKVNLLKALGIILSLFVLGGIAYSLLYPLKYTIRYGTDFSLSNCLTISEGIGKMTDRVSHLNITAYVHDNINEIVRRYHMQNIDLIEFKAAFRPLIPSAIFTNKIFSSIGSCIHNAMSGYYTGINITGNCAILEYYRLMIHCDAIDLIMSLILFIAMLWVIKYICNCFASFKYQFEYMLFWMLMSGYSICGTIENSISGSYFKIVFFIPLFWILGIVKVRYKRNLSNIQS